MATTVPESAEVGLPNEPAADLGEALDGLLEFVGATAGWVGVRGAAGRLTFPVRRGDFAEAWLTLQQAQCHVWGFEVREGPSLLNDLGPVPPLGSPPLRNLLSCPLEPTGPPSSPASTSARGQVVLANKPSGFTAHDAAVLQGVAHLMGRRLARQGGGFGPASELPAALLRRVLDRAGEGILVVDSRGTLVYANTTWLRWTGFGGAEVIGRPAPFPFWVSHRELAALPGLAEVPPAGPLPFRRRDHSLFWCRLDTAAEEDAGRSFRVAFLRQAPAPTAGPDAAHPRPTVFLRPARREAPPGEADRSTLPLLLDELPFALALVDRKGQLLWSNAALDRLAPAEARPGALLRDRLPRLAAALEYVFRDPGNAEPGRMGSLTMPRDGLPLAAFWLAVGRPEGTGFLVALTADADGFTVTGLGSAEPRLPATLPAPDWLALLLQPGGEFGLWNERWERLTGLAAADLGDVRAEVLLDWLFPKQRDRELVADFLHRPTPQGGQAVLNILSRTGSRPLLCTFLPVGRLTASPGGARVSAAGASPSPDSWLLLVGEPQLCAGVGSPSLGFMRQFARGLNHLLNHYLTVPIGQAEIALDRPELPPEVAGWFGQILDSCLKATRLMAGLEDLAAVTPGETSRVSLADLVREFLDEQASANPERDYELVVNLGDDEAPVRVNRRLLRVVLRHLFTNAEQALLGCPRRQIEVRVRAADGMVRCEIHDTGEGLPSEDMPRTLTPFFSTKGPFARDPAHAALDATGLGLTVSQHLLALHDGYLELHTTPGARTTAAIVLPRAQPAPVTAFSPTAADLVRLDPARAAPGPHTRVDSPSASEPPV